MRLPSRAAATATLAALPPRNLPNDLDVLEADADLQRVDVDAAAPDGEDVERFRLAGQFKATPDGRVSGGRARLVRLCPASLGSCQ